MPQYKIKHIFFIYTFFLSNILESAVAVRVTKVMPQKMESLCDLPDVCLEVIGAFLVSSISEIDVHDWPIEEKDLMYWSGSSKVHRNQRSFIIRMYDYAQIYMKLICNKIEEKHTYSYNLCSEMLQDYVNDKWIGTLRILNDGNKERLISTATGGNITIWDIDTKKPLKNIKSDISIESLCVINNNIENLTFALSYPSKDIFNRKLPFKARNDKIGIWNMKTGQEKKTFETDGFIQDARGNGAILGISSLNTILSNNKKLLLAQYELGGASIWDLENQNQETSLLFFFQNPKKGYASIVLKESVIVVEFSKWSQYDPGNNPEGIATVYKIPIDCLSNKDHLKEAIDNQQNSFFIKLGPVGLCKVSLCTMKNDKWLVTAHGNNITIYKLDCNYKLNGKKIMSIDSYSKNWVSEGHFKSIGTLHIDGEELLVSLSNDNSLRLWNVDANTKQLVGILRETYQIFDWRVIYNSFGEPFVALTNGEQIKLCKLKRWNFKQPTPQEEAVPVPFNSEQSGRVITDSELPPIDDELTHIINSPVKSMLNSIVSTASKSARMIVRRLQENSKPVLGKTKNFFFRTQNAHNNARTMYGVAYQQAMANI